ncbi:MAG: sugar phosphate nucleotidyltransferase [Candidatus Nanohalobium sp.]
MKAIVLAGGHATRLWPVTKDRAKPLLPLGEKPIIDFIVEDLEKEADDVIISTNKKFAEDFEDYTEEYDRDARVVVEDQGSEEEKPGTIGAILKLIEKEDIDDDLLVIGGDNLYSFNILDFLDFCREKEAPATVAYDVENEEVATSFGIVDLEGEKLVDFVEKPDNPPSTLAGIACYYFPQEDVSLYKRYDEHFSKTDVPAEKYLDEPGRLIEWAHEKTDMYAYTFNGYWYDVGTPKGYLDALENVMGRNMVKGEVVNSEIGENVMVMEGARIEDSKLQNTVVFPNTEVKGSELRNSLVDSHSEVREVDLNDAIIGKHTEL